MSTLICPALATPGGGFVWEKRMDGVTKSTRSSPNLDSVKGLRNQFAPLPLGKADFLSVGTCFKMFYYN